MTLYRKSYNAEDGHPIFTLLSQVEEDAARAEPLNVFGNDSGFDVVIEGADADAYRASQAVAAAIPRNRVVSAYQAKLALDDVGLFIQVQAVCITHAVRAVRIFWDSAHEWRENGAILQAIAAEIGIEDAEMREVFRLAVLKQE